MQNDRVFQKSNSRLDSQILAVDPNWDQSRKTKIIFEESCFGKPFSYDHIKLTIYLFI